MIFVLMLSLKIINMIHDPVKKPKWNVRLVLWFAKTFFYPKREVVRSEESKNEEAAVYICNHSTTIGPMNAVLYFDRPAVPWVTHCVFDKKVRTNYVFHDIFRARQYKCKFFFRWLARFIAWFLHPLLVAQDSIKVYRTDSRIMNTYKESIQRIKEGCNLIIFPESPVKYNTYINKLYDGIADLGFFVWKTLHIKLKYYPTYIPPKLKTINVGEPVVFNPDNPIEVERERINKLLEDKFQIIGDSLPKHKIVRFLPESYYKYYGEFENDPKAFWKFVDQKKSK